MFLPKLGELESDAEWSHASWHIASAGRTSLGEWAAAKRGGGDGAGARWVWEVYEWVSSLGTSGGVWRLSPCAPLFQPLTSWLGSLPSHSSK